MDRTRDLALQARVQTADLPILGYCYIFQAVVYPIPLPNHYVRPQNFNCNTLPYKEL